MTIQVFVQGKLTGIESFVAGPSASGEPAGRSLVVGRCYWISLLSEVLPRALLKELGLAQVLLGLSGGGGFLMVLPKESLEAAEEILTRAAAAIHTLSGSQMRLAWGWTENLGDWSIVRKRIAESLWKRVHTDPLAATPDAFAPRTLESGAATDSAFEEMAAAFREAKTVAWSPTEPGMVRAGEGKHVWTIGSLPDGVPFPRHTALTENGDSPSELDELAGRATGKSAWGVLRADVDGFGVRLRRTSTVEEYLQLSMLLRQFFAGELEIQCMLPEFWRRVTILYTGGDDFAVFGSWDALVPFAREIQRLFHIFAEVHLKDLPGPEGKTISMALEVAAPDAPFGSVYEAAGRSLEAAKSADKDCFHLFGRTVEWRQMQHIYDLKELMLRMVGQFGCAPQFLEELSSFYHDKPASGRPDRPWRYHRRLGVVLGDHKDRELQRLRTALITDIVGKSPAQVKLRPAGSVAVEWARMLASTRRSVRGRRGSAAAIRPPAPPPPAAPQSEPLQT